jgi:hypothetical protein
MYLAKKQAERTQRRGGRPHAPLSPLTLYDAFPL